MRCSDKVQIQNTFFVSSITLLHFFSFIVEADTFSMFINCYDSFFFLFLNPPLPAISILLISFIYFSFCSNMQALFKTDTAIISFTSFQILNTILFLIIFLLFYLFALIVIAKVYFFTHCNDLHFFFFQIFNYTLQMFKTFSHLQPHFTLFLQPPSPSMLLLSLIYFSQYFLHSTFSVLLFLHTVFPPKNTATTFFIVKLSCHFSFHTTFIVFLPFYILWHYKCFSNVSFHFEQSMYSYFTLNPQLHLPSLLLSNSCFLLSIL